jgi:PilZ domain-containing protein
VDPQDLHDTAHAEIRKVLGDPLLRGERFDRAVGEIGSRHDIEPFRALFRALTPIDLPEAQARSTLRAIEEHRASMESLLGRDPGLGVAALDYLHDLEGVIREPAVRDAPAEQDPRLESEAPPETGSFEELCNLEARRGERTGRPLAAVVLAPDGDRADSEEAMEAAAACLRDRARETDHAHRTGCREFTLILPGTDGEQALAGAERLRRAFCAATGIAWSAGMAACAGPPWDVWALCGEARAAVREARERGGDATRMQHPERREHPRKEVGPSLQASLSVEETVEPDTVIEDLSLGGALLGTREDIPPGAEVRLTLREISPRPRQVEVASRVRRVEDATDATPGPARRAAVAFVEDGEVRLRIARLLADLPAGRGREGGGAGVRMPRREGS